MKLTYPITLISEAQVHIINPFEILKPKYNEYTKHHREDETNETQRND